MAKEFYSHGKLLLTGEYAVLDGALSLAIPTQYGQSLRMTETPSGNISWKSWDEKGVVWFETVFGLEQFSSLSNGKASSKPTSVVETLFQLLTQAKKLNPQFLTDQKGYEIETHLTFPRNWGLGSSSTLINNIAQWAQVDAYNLLWNSFSGSGYDIACAQTFQPLLYRLQEEKPIVQKVDFDPPFKDQLYFIYLNKKQDSREGIDRYRQLDPDKKRLVEGISEITEKIVASKTLSSFELLVIEHETMLSRELKIPTVREFLFPDFKNAIKSLGAWGGDFVLATGGADVPVYFKEKGYGTVIPYSKMILS